MTFGQKIKKLRIDAGLTQKDLAEKMNVSFQTVSKWESDLNEPDITSIKELCKIFSCSFEYLLGDDIEPTKENVSDVESTPVRTPFAKCKDCGKDLYSDDYFHNVERKSESGFKDMVYICDDCFLKHEKEMDEKIAKINKSIEPDDSFKSKSGPFHKITNRNDSKVIIWSIVIGALAFVISLVLCIIYTKNIGIGLTIALPLIISYTLFADIYCLFTASWVSDVFMEVASWSIKMPGIIFTFDLDGLKFLIIMKITLWLIGVAVSIGVFLLAVAISSVCSIFTFPFLIVYNKKHYC